MKRIKLSKGKYALVDDEDYEWLNKYNWAANKCGRKRLSYRAMRTKTKDCKFTYMHRMILGVTDPNIFVDHRDRNPLNNQRKNLRTCTVREGACNLTKVEGSASKYLGVCFHDSKFKYKDKNGIIKYYRSPGWSAIITKNYKAIFLGRFKTENEAALAYNEGAVKYHGEFANLNKV